VTNDVMRREASSLSAKQRGARRVMVFLSILTVAVLFKWVVTVSGKHVAADDGNNVRAAFNFVHYGVLSDETPQLGETPAPTNYREPFPSLVLSGYIAVFEAIYGPRDSQYFEEGLGARALKYSNILWGAVLCASVFAAVSALTGEMTLAGATAATAGVFFQTDDYLTEPAAAALLALFSVFAMMSVRTGCQRYFGFAGLALGVLVLTKAAFFYVGGLLLASLAIWLGVWGRAKWGAGGAALRGALFVLCAAVVIAPWVARNYVYLGAAQITQRAGAVLYMRAVKNEMTAAEYAGSFYVWARPGVRSMIGALSGFGPQDLQKGGSLQRLNRKESDFHAADIAAESAGRPDLAISFYYQARAERNRLTNEFRREGRHQPKIEADAELQRRATAMILADPLNHAVMTLPFLWRGAFYEAPPLFLIALWALWRRRADLLAFVLPSIAMIAFYAVASHNITRYNDPAVPVVIASLAVFGTLRWRRRRAEGERSREGD